VVRYWKFRRYLNWQVAEKSVGHFPYLLIGKRRLCSGLRHFRTVSQLWVVWGLLVVGKTGGARAMVVGW
jgi:hypothetical protein